MTEGTRAGINAVSQRPFPIARSFIALIVVPVGTVVVPLFIGDLFQRTPPWEHLSWWASLKLWFLFTASAACYYAIPGYITFLVLGIPSLYLLHRWKRLGFGWFMLLGALYTALPFPFLAWFVGYRSEYLAIVGPYTSVFALVGILGGILTRLIVFGGFSSKKGSARPH